MDLATDVNEGASSLERADCPLCGFQFAKGEAACGGCAMMRGCSMLRCPNCRYEFVTESKVVQWVHKTLKKLG